MVGDDKAKELLRTWSEAPNTVAILTDIDGTLAPIVPTPDMSEVPAEIKEHLRRVSERVLLGAGGRGRNTEDAPHLLGPADAASFGQHRLEIPRECEVGV